MLSLSPGVSAYGKWYDVETQETWALPRSFLCSSNATSFSRCYSKCTIRVCPIHFVDGFILFATASFLWQTTLGVNIESRGPKNTHAQVLQEWACFVHIMRSKSREGRASGNDDDMVVIIIRFLLPKRRTFEPNESWAIDGVVIRFEWERYFDTNSLRESKSLKFW